jgi:membrane associated rhomboid family serine protease
MPVIGASGAIAGVMGAYIFLFPRSTVRTLVISIFVITTIHIPASVYLGIWLIIQLMGGFSGDDANNVAFFAHVGGFISGFLVAWVLSWAGMIQWYPDDRGYKGPWSGPRPDNIIVPGNNKYIWRD